VTPQNRHANGLQKSDMKMQKHAGSMGHLQRSMINPQNNLPLINMTHDPAHSTYRNTDSLQTFSLITLTKRLRL